MTSTIEYVGGGTDVMDFELFEPVELALRAAPCGLALDFACCGWNAARPPSPEAQRHQAVFRRR